MANPPKLTTLKFAGEVSSIGATTLRKMCREGKIEGAEKYGNTWLIPYEWVMSQEDPMPPAEGHVSLIHASIMAGMSREAMRQLLERGKIRGSKRLINERNRWRVDEQSLKAYITQKNCVTEEKELFTFYDYIKMIEALTDMNNYVRDARVLWDIHGEDYKTYCEAEGYESEAI